MKDIAIILGVGLLYIVALVIFIFCLVTAAAGMFFVACGTISFWSWLFGGGSFVSVCLS